MVVSIINAALGVIVGVGAFLLGFPNPAIFGLAAAVLNYIPYVGPAVMVVILFGVGLVSFPSAFVAPLAFVALTTAEGHFITPTIVGRRITLNPLLVFLALAFWTWLWGPIGAFLAALDRRACRVQSRVPARRGQTSRLNGTFFALYTCRGKIRA